MKKITYSLLSIMVICALVFTASAAPAAGNGSHLSTLVSSALRLMFETDNVTIHAKAAFSLDGTQFKALDATLMQDGYNSFMKISLDTPKPDGTVYTGGYTVIGQGDTAYWMETYKGPYFFETFMMPHDTVIRKTPVIQAAAQFARQFASLLSAGIQEHIGLTEDGGMQKYRVSLSGGEIPDTLNAAFNLAAAAYFRSLSPLGPAAYTASAVYEDWDGLFAFYYREATGRTMPKGFMEDAMTGPGPSNDLYNTISDMMNRNIEDTIKKYTSGVVYFRSDGNVEWYGTYADYMRAAGVAYVYYTDADAAFRAFYQKKTGEELSAIVLKTIRNSANEALVKVYTDMWEKMDAYYKGIALADADAVAIRVDGSGGYTLLDTMDEPNGITVTRRIISMLSEIAVSSADCEVTLDGSGNPLKATGNAAFSITDRAGQSQALDITFDLAASSYGETSVAAFDPNAFGVSSYNDYAAELYAEEVETDYPETVMFNGVEYLSRVYR